MNILLIRNDKLGDFILTWPALALLKAAIPQARIAVLVAPFTTPLAALLPWLDEVISDNFSSTSTLAEALKSREFTVAITLNSTPRTALALRQAKIPYRLAPATKWVQILYNQRLIQRRSRSLKPEYAYNCDLISRFLTDHHLPAHALGNQNDWLPPTLQRPLFSPPVEKGDSTPIAVLIHPGSGGSASTLSACQYGWLIDQLVTQGMSAIYLLAGPGERLLAESVKRASKNGAAKIIEPATLPELVKVLAKTALFIGGSSGPLHLAGALNIATIAFYPGHRSATALRWQTVNAPNRRLAISAPGKHVNMIDLNAHWPTIAAFIKQQNLAEVS
ncbi:MAG: glycosyltransferase family 9 protein [Gammaproteobacteria bacterium]|nr:glycosyltransferase family 9 protein [Gammaproteobacteria bacterium]